MNTALSLEAEINTNMNKYTVALIIFVSSYLGVHLLLYLDDYFRYKRITRFWYKDVLFYTGIVSLTVLFAIWISEVLNSFS